MAFEEELDRVLAERAPDAVCCDERFVPLAEPLIRYTTDHGFRRLESPDGQFLLWVRAAKAE